MAVTATQKSPEGVQADKIKADFKNGVVEITAPLAKEIAARNFA